MELADGFGRVARDLRVSLTDRCNLRCSYCMPSEMDWIPDDQLLTDAEMVRVLRVGIELLGINKLRFTGGEPLLRPGLESIIAQAAKLRTAAGSRPEIGLTTNGLGLHHRLDALIAAGLDRVNISLDSLDRQRYAQLTRRDRLDGVLDSIAAVADAGLTPVKINTVIMRGQNEEDVVPLAEFCLSNGFQLRFIEQMPLGPAGSWDRQAMVQAEEILELLRERFELMAVAEPRGSTPAQLWQVAPDATQPGGEIGVIASVTRPFCGVCDRSRLTSDGQIRNCLFAQQETDLRSLLRNGASDTDLAEAWAGEHRRKAPAHGIDDPGFTPPARKMSAIGG